MYRIAQESVTNAVRHSQCSNIKLFLSRDKNTIIIKIKDDGTGMNGVSDNKDGMGLKIIHYRASMIEAVLDMHGNEKGTFVKCSFSDNIT